MVRPPLGSSSIVLAARRLGESMIHLLPKGHGLDAKEQGGCARFYREFCSHNLCQFGGAHEERARDN